jgi:hypothetical protein
MPQLYPLTDELEGQIEIHLPYQRAEVTLAILGNDTRYYCRHTVFVNRWEKFSGLVATLRQIVADVIPEGDANRTEALEVCDMMLECAAMRDSEDQGGDE